MTILRSPAGPVISTRRSWRSAGTGATRQSPSRTERVSSRKSGSSPASIRSWRSARARRSSSRRPANSRWSATTRSSASGVRTPASSGALTTAVAMALNLHGHLELGLLGRALQRERRALPARDGLEHRVEVAGPDLALVACRRVAELLVRELRLLKSDVRAHPFACVAACELEHRVADGVEAGQRHELEAVAHRRQLPLERRDRLVVEVLAPVERRRAVVCEQLAGELPVHRVGELRGLVQVGGRRLAPEDVGVRRVRESAGDRRLDPGRYPEEAFRGSLPGDELAIAL